MKKQILEVQNYFINKITACDFDTVEIKYSNNGWVHFQTVVDEKTFVFSILPNNELYCLHESFIKIEIPNDRLQNLIYFIEAHKEKVKAEKIEKLKAELAELEAEAQVLY